MVRWERASRQVSPAGDRQLVKKRWHLGTYGWTSLLSRPGRFWWCCLGTAVPATVWWCHRRWYQGQSWSPWVLSLLLINWIICWAPGMCQAWISGAWNTKWPRCGPSPQRAGKIDLCSISSKSHLHHFQPLLQITHFFRPSCPSAEN